MAMKKRIDGKTVLTLIAMGVSTIILAADFSAMAVALFEIDRSFDYKSLIR
jgi:hypothetical protein